MPLTDCPAHTELFMKLLTTIPFLLLLYSCEPAPMPGPEAPVLTSTTTIGITKSWPQEPSGFTYPISVRLPSVTMPEEGFPVCILLHGNGGTGAQILSQFSIILDDHILVAPEGYQNSWNLCAETSDAPDIEMVNDLIDSLQTYSNVNPQNIRILGISNGAGLANSVWIEHTNEGVDIVCAIVSHLNEPQFHSDAFHRIGSRTDPGVDYCGYQEEAQPISTRKYLSISNENDPIIPYEGGSSAVGINFLPAEEAIYVIAQYQGSSEGRISGPGMSIGSPEIHEYAYLSGQVVHIRGQARHGLNSTQISYIQSFFSN